MYLGVDWKGRRSTFAGKKIHPPSYELLSETGKKNKNRKVTEFGLQPRLFIIHYTYNIRVKRAVCRKNYRFLGCRYRFETQILRTDARACIIQFLICCKGLNGRDIHIYIYYPGGGPFPFS